MFLCSVFFFVADLHYCEKHIFRTPGPDNRICHKQSNLFKDRHTVTTINGILCSYYSRSVLSSIAVVCSFTVRTCLWGGVLCESLVRTATCVLFDSKTCAAVDVFVAPKVMYTVYKYDSRIVSLWRAMRRGAVPWVQVRRLPGRGRRVSLGLGDDGRSFQGRRARRRHAGEHSGLPRGGDVPAYSGRGGRAVWFLFRMPHRSHSQMLLVR